MSALSITPIAADGALPVWKRHLLIAGAATVIVAIPMLVAGQYIAAVLVPAVFGLFLYYLFRRFDGSQRVTFAVGAGKLAVRGDFFADSFFLSELDLARAEAIDLRRDPQRKLRWKTLGTGLPGYYSGEYALADGQPAIVFVADKSRVLYIPRRSGPALLLSVPDPAAFKALLLRAQAQA